MKIMTKKYVITFSYGDCSRGTGGTDKAIMTQIHLLNGAGYTVLSLSPHIEKNNYWDVLLNGKILGVFSTKRFKAYISNLKNCIFCSFIIHHLKNIDIIELESLINYIDIPILFYLHDYYTICPIGGLVRKNGIYCGIGFPEKDKCINCEFYNDSIIILERYKDFLCVNEHRLTYIIPSDTAKQVWLQHYPEYKVKVIYHQNLMGEYTGNNLLLSDEEPLKIGFVGYQRPLKGWEPFKKAVAQAHKLGLNEFFYQFGWGDEKLPYIEQVSVDFQKSITAMTDALREQQIHVAVLWSTWPETYAYTYYESFAANCFVITNNMSGNVCTQVRERKNGIVVDDLSEILCDEQRLRKLVNEFRENGHITPNNLKENEEFLSLIPDNGRKLQKVGKVLDFSCVLSILKKSKNMIKGWIKRV